MSSLVACMKFVLDCRLLLPSFVDPFTLTKDSAGVHFNFYCHCSFKCYHIIDSAVDNLLPYSTKHLTFFGLLYTHHITCINIYQYVTKYIIYVTFSFQLLGCSWSTISLLSLFLLNHRSSIFWNERRNFSVGQGRAFWFCMHDVTSDVYEFFCFNA